MALVERSMSNYAPAVLSPELWTTWPPADKLEKFIPLLWTPFMNYPVTSPLAPGKARLEAISKSVFLREVSNLAFSATTNQSNGLQTVSLLMLVSFLTSAKIWNLWFLPKWLNPAAQSNPPLAEILPVPCTIEFSKPSTSLNSPVNWLSKASLPSFVALNLILI